MDLQWPHPPKEYISLSEQSPTAHGSSDSTDAFWNFDYQQLCPTQKSVFHRSPPSPSQPPLAPGKLSCIILWNSIFSTFSPFLTFFNSPNARIRSLEVLLVSSFLVHFILMSTSVESSFVIFHFIHERLLIGYFNGS